MSAIPTKPPKPDEEEKKERVIPMRAIQWNEDLGYVPWCYSRYMDLEDYEMCKELIDVADDNIEYKHIKTLLDTAKVILTAAELEKLKQYIYDELGPEVLSEAGKILEFKVGTYYNSPKFVVLRRDGIYSYVEKYNKEEEKYYKTNREPLWIWDEFKILRILIDKSSEPEQELYDYKYNGKEYDGETFDEMKHEIAKKSCLKSSNKQIFGQVIYRYIKKIEPPRIDYRQICGFTGDGWIFPDEYYIKFNRGIQKDFKKNIEEMLKIRTENLKTKEKMRELYNNVLAVEHKDIILAYGAVHPFLFALMSYTRLMPFLALYSNKHTTGKSSGAKLITKRFWNNFDLLTSKDLNRKSHKRDYLSAGTFGICIDESENLEDHANDDLKGTATNKIPARYKNVDQSLGMNKYFCSPIIYTFNIPPKIFNDTRYISRGLFIEVTKDLTEYEDRYKDFMRTVNDGEFGKAIINATRDWKLEDVIEHFNKIDAPQGLISRQRTIFKIIHLGGIIFKKAFDIDLDLLNLEKLIKKSEKFGSDNIFTIVKKQLEEGVKKEEVWYDEEGGEHVNYVFKPELSWIRAIVARKRYKETNGYVYDADNLQDLKNRLRIEIKGVKELGEILSKKWDIGEYKSYKVKDDVVWGIFIKDKSIREHGKQEYIEDYFSE